MTVNVTTKQNLLVKRIKRGEGHSVSLENGCVMAIQIVWMVQMRTLLYIIVQLLNHVGKISSLAQTGDVLTR